MKGIDIEEAAICWALALGLWYARDAFYVRQDRAGLPRAIARAATLAALSTATATAAVFAAGDHITPDAPMSHAMSRALRFLILDGSAVDVARPFAWLPAALGVLGIGTLLTMGALLLGPARPKGPQDADERLRAEGLIIY